MRSELPPLPTREPSNPAIVATPRLWHTETPFVTDDPVILRRLADGLRTLPGEHHTDDCLSRTPVRGHSHAHQLMAAHAGHHCPRYTTAAEYTTGIRP
ncbi:hypothetical protein [Nocardia sp. NPDC024068]|uniref:hypothetical protein n=1 Tax=Nocardia sp. NPDC024068 TaxID=3157197 RepID=UPI0033FDBBD6